MEKLGEKNHFDFSLFFTAIILWITGVFIVYSATYFNTSEFFSSLYKSQIIWISLGILLILTIISVPTRVFYSIAYVVYILSLFLLLYGLIEGISSKGASRWISVAGIRIQPSEFSKIGLLLALARYLSNNPLSLTNIKSFIMPGILIIIPFILVIEQPDLGTALVFCAMTLPMFYWAGMSIIEIFYAVSPGISIALSAIPLILSFGSTKPFGITSALPWGIFFIILCIALYKNRPHIFLLIIIVAMNLFTATSTTVIWNSFLKDYQKTRIVSFINPQADPYGSGYQVIQSKVAIGSGHIFGKGYLHGTQTRLSYLPEQHTDFIFSVLGEQFGIVGCGLILVLFMFLVMRAIYTTHYIRNRFTNLVIIGSIAIISFHIVVNIAMVIGMMPVAGIPLPFLSYGGSFTITIATLMGLILNAKISRQDF